MSILVDFSSALLAALQVLIRSCDAPSRSITKTRMADERHIGVESGLVDELGILMSRMLWWGVSTGDNIMCM
ncbi:hypothetical protein L917_14385 [Phytophthora nicotianae]|uniref:RxLR effector candidate protein n=1 Tax=Phytophthora nicotianae TaxID=4792 RepID=W2KNL0_PHYNI|nr:hypothetical protein L915_14671 [Phytophthora nicotianae]ETL32893.1 hypothetical protein L916_14579 [Phytophthora nicotianae]ETL32907.1 hypothetical protein L916_14577 [Phytophthora nicotianae]ETL86169.1 hypothetical protein L917_14385 [Phytophthora nicotianae]ETM39325.1 hypothetical protein L914_14522 [Phytophthora nicotianae]